MKEPIQTLNFNSNSTEHLSLPYRRGVGLMVINKEKKVFVGKRINTTAEAWQMPQGGIDQDEHILEAGKRELQEETNIVDVQIIAESKTWLHYDLPDSLIGKLWEGKYRGQKQKWLLMYFFGQDSSINLKTSTPEFEKWQWLEVTKLPEIIVSFKRDLYISVTKEFQDIIENFQIPKK